MPLHWFRSTLLVTCGCCGCIIQDVSGCRRWPCVGLSWSAFVNLNICTAACVCTQRRATWPGVFTSVDGAHGVISHGNQWTREWEGGERGIEGGGKKKIGKESRLSPVINGGIPARRKGRRGRRVAQGKDLDSLRKNTACLAWRESRQLSILIKASQPAQRRQKTMAGSIVREERREGERDVGQRKEG